MFLTNDLSGRRKLCFRSRKRGRSLDTSRNIVGVVTNLVRELDEPADAAGSLDSRVEAAQGASGRFTGQEIGYALVAKRRRGLINDGLAFLQRQVFNGAAAQEVAQRQAILSQGLKGR